MRVLITGVAGFLGSHIVDHILVNTDWEIVGVASWRHKGIPERILDSKHYQANKDRVKIITHDLSAPITQLTKRSIGGVDYIIQAASDSHVDRSITDPVPFIKNNVDVVLNVLEFAREVKPKAVFVVSTDEVYGAQDMGVFAKEWDSHIPSNPYSASKAAQEDIAIAYWRTYSVPVVICNAQNLIGERQDKEKFTPMIIRSVLGGDELTIHIDAKTGEPGSRVYLHCRNYADAILWLIKNHQPKMFPEVDRPDRYNIAGESRLNNLEYAELIADIIGNPLNYKLVDAHSSRPGHDPHYLMSGEKMEKLGWVPPFKLEESLRKTIEWFNDPDNAEWLSL